MNKWTTLQVTFITEYPQATLGQDVYMYLSQDIQPTTSIEKVSKSLKSLYGGKYSGRKFYEFLEKFQYMKFNVKCLRLTTSSSSVTVSFSASM